MSSHSLPPVNQGKLGFWAVFSLVVGSQIGSGVFMLPSSLAPYGFISFFGLGIASCGALSLAYVFSKLSMWFPKTGGPHVYVHVVFGASASFFTGWTYWIISWVSTTAVITACIGYLEPLIGPQSHTINLILEITLLLLFTSMNACGVIFAGKAEIFLSSLKILPLFILPLVGLYFFQSHNIVCSEVVEVMEPAHALGAVALLTLWGFIGLESGTTPAGSVDNPSHTIPKAVFFGTLFVACVYFFNNVGILGSIPSQILAQSQAPYADAAKILMGGNIHKVIALFAMLICMGTLNAWMLTSGQIALGLAQDKLLPSFFGKTNRRGAPMVSLVLSALGVTPLLFMTANQGIAKQVLAIIDISVTAFLFVYALCCVSFLRLVVRRQERVLTQWIVGIFALAFCLWVISATSLMTLGCASLFVISGLPIRFLSHLK